MTDAPLFKDHPFDDVCKQADAMIRKGWTVYQKFTCEQCKARQTIDVPNTFYTEGSCEECGHITDLRASGCNMLIMRGFAHTEEQRQRAMARSAKEVEERNRKS